MTWFCIWFDDDESIMNMKWDEMRWDDMLFTQSVGPVWVVQCSNEWDILDFHLWGKHFDACLEYCLSDLQM